MSNGQQQPAGGQPRPGGRAGQPTVWTPPEGVTRPPANAPAKPPTNPPASASATAPANAPAETLAETAASTQATAPANAPAQTPAETTADVPAKAPVEASTGRTGAAPANAPAETPAETTADVPAKAQAEAPARRTGEAPANPQADAAAEATRQMPGAAAEPGAEATTEVTRRPPAKAPREAPAETTAPLPAVPAVANHQQEHRTVGLPLLDLLAPEQNAPPPAPGFGPTPSREPLPYQPGAYEQPLYDPPLYGGFQAQSSYEPPPQGPPVPQAPYEPAQYAPYRQPPRRRPRWTTRPGAGLVVALAAGVLVVAVLGIWALSGGSPERPSAPSSAAAPTSTQIRVAAGYQFARHAARTDTDCAANAYGKVAEFFRATPCTGLDRALYSTTVDGRIVAVSVSIVRMPTEQAATDLKKLADTNGTGNVSDLLRAGVRVPGGPESFTDAGYASGRDGSTVVIAEADFADRAVKDEPLLDKISEAALQLR